MIYYLIASIFYFLLMCFTFNECIRKSSYYTYVCLILNLCSAFLWFSFVKNLPNREEVLFHSVYWDLMIIVIGYILPLFIFEFKLNYIQMIGIIVIFIGFCLLKGFND